MRTLAVALVALLFINMAIKAEGPGQPEIVWTADKGINGPEEFDQNVSLRMESGINVTFGVPEVYPPDLWGPIPSVTVHGTLAVNGTTSQPVVFDGGPEILEVYGMPPYLCVNGTPDATRFFIRNASFNSMMLHFENASGVISDCAFNSSEVCLLSCQVAFVNCTFAGTYIPIWGEGASSTSFTQCDYDDYAIKLPKWATDHSVGISLHGDISMTGCSFRASGTIMHGFAGNFTMTDSYLKGGPAHSGIGLYYSNNLNRGARSHLYNVTFDGMTLYTDTDTIIEECTFYNCEHGVSLNRIQGHWNAQNETYQNLSNLIMRNNTFYNNSVAIRIEGPVIDLSQNRFEGANGTNNTMILTQHCRHYVLVADQTGRWIDYPTINTTSANGTTEGHNYSGFKDCCIVDLLELTIDGGGNRQTHYPYSIFAQKDGLLSETQTITPLNLGLTLVVPILNDLVPSNLTPDRRDIIAGRGVSISVEVENRGFRNSSGVLAVLYIDGVRHDEVNISSIVPDGKFYQGFKDWTATSGRHTIEVRLDPENTIPEYNDTNNNLTLTLVVPAQPLPDRTWTYVQLGVIVIAAMAIVGVYIIMRNRRLH